LHYFCMVSSFTRIKIVKGKEVVRISPASIHRLVKRFNYFNDQVSELAGVIQSRTTQLKRSGKHLPAKTRATFVKLNEVDSQRIQDYLKKATKYYELVLKAEKR
jgi:hypothetical protein